MENGDDTMGLERWQSDLKSSEMGEIDSLWRGSEGNERSKNGERILAKEKEMQLKSDYSRIENEMFDGMLKIDEWN